MSQIKIYYQRKVSPRAGQFKTVIFDSILGVGSDTNHPYILRLKKDGQIIQDRHQAEELMAQPIWGNGQTLYQKVPMLPALPPKTIIGTYFRKYPENTPIDRPEPYRCHFMLNGNLLITWLKWDKNFWDLMGITEYTESMIDNAETIENPDYSPAKAEYDAKMVEYKQFLQEYFAQFMNVKSPNIPTQEDNEALVPSLLTTLKLTEPAQIPRDYFYRWWIINPGSKTEITVEKGQYDLPPVLHEDFQNEFWNTVVNNTVLTADPVARMQLVLSL